jgi:MoxR-vWA-beta-propeller ternary system domain bpX2
VNLPWVICLARADAAWLAPLRLNSGVQVAEADELIWLRGRNGDEHLARALRGLPAAARYEWLGDDRLRRLGTRIPAGTLPQLRWQALGDWLRVDLPAAAIPACEPRPVPLRIIRSAEEQAADLLLTDLSEWTRFASEAAEVRLRRLQFAVDAGAKALVRGTPLPPLPGQRFVLHRSIAVPAGFEWYPAVGADVLMVRLGVSSEALVLWHEDGTLTRLHADQFVPATRSAVRATAQAFATRMNP